MKIRYFSETGEPMLGTPKSAGYDLCVSLPYEDRVVTTIDAYDPMNEPCSIKTETDYLQRVFISIPPRHRVLVPTGLYTAPEDCDPVLWFAIVLRSSAGWKKGLQIPNSVGVIDQDYRGQWRLILFNPLQVPIIIHHEERLAQFIPLRSEPIEWESVANSGCITNDKTIRGSSGFGSTGK